MRMTLAQARSRMGGDTCLCPRCFWCLVHFASCHSLPTSDVVDRNLYWTNFCSSYRCGICVCVYVCPAFSIWCLYLATDSVDIAAVCVLSCCV